MIECNYILEYTWENTWDCMVKISYIQIFRSFKQKYDDVEVFFHCRLSGELVVFVELHLHVAGVLSTL